MAEVQVVIVKVEKTVEVDETRVALGLSDEEAHALADVVSCVGGSPYTSRRGLIEKIYNALRDAGYSYENSPKAKFEGPYARVADLEGTLFFE